MRLIFAGTPEFAVPILQALARVHDVRVVLTQPDRPRGRSLRMDPTPVKAAAEGLGIEVMQPEDLGDPAILAQLRSVDARAMIVAAYGRILRSEVLSVTPVGCVNVHPSLLPAYRGAAPIQRAVMNGDAESGVSIMHLDEGMDTGPVYAQVKVPIGEDETAGELAAELGRKSTHLLLEVLDEIERGTANLTPQPDEGASIAEKIEKGETRIDWRRTAKQIHNQVRALNPAPGARTTLSGRGLKVWRTRAAVDGVEGEPGEVVELDPHLRVSTGGGDILLVEVQPESKGHMSAIEFVRGYHPMLGERLGRS